ncbi:MAG: hypothetical protein BYD32DRAFT_416821, partial [Podila humilis]
MSTSKKPMKRSVSSASLSSKARKQPDVSRLSQTPINSFFTKAPKTAGEPKSAAPASGASVAQAISVKEVSAPSTTSGGDAKISLKMRPARPKSVIIDDDDDIEKNRKEKQQAGKGSNNNTNNHIRDPSIQRRPAALSSVKRKHLVPFEDRMPVSPPGSPVSTKLQLIEEKTTLKPPLQAHKTKQEIVLDQAPVISTATTIEHIDKTETQTSQASSEKVTPQKNTPQKVTPQKSRTPSSNTFRTPTEKFRRKGATFESLGLSPEDSVFWVKTPPMEAFKKLASLNSGRSHEEEIASIVGRLYQNSSAGSALQSMDCGPKDRIRNMLDTLRGSNSSVDSQDEDEYDDPDKSEHHSSPTRNIASRQHLLMTNRTESELIDSPPQSQTVPRKRGRNNRSGLLQMARGKTASQATQVARPRAEVLRMIEQLKTNMEGDTVNRRASSVGPPAEKWIQLNQVDIPRSGLTRVQSQPIFPSTPTKTPTKSDQVQNAAVNASPDDFGSFLDFEIGEEDLEELTQFEMSAVMSTTSSNLSTISCPLNSRPLTAEAPFPRAEVPKDEKAFHTPSLHHNSTFAHTQAYDEEDLDDVAEFFMD